MSKAIGKVMLAVAWAGLFSAAGALAEEGPGLGEWAPFEVAAADTGLTNTTESGAYEKRLEAEKASNRSGWAITPHRPNYILPFTYNSSPNSKPFRGGTDIKTQEAEAKFQISFKLPVWEEIFDSNFSVFFAYTQISFWQVYNTDNSSPFRDTNYEPEAIFVYRTPFEFLGFKLSALNLGVVHQSNGRGNSDISRSWNRAYVGAVFQRGNFVWSLKPWYRFPEAEKEEGDSKGDDNPHIEKWMGYGELRAGYKWGNQNFSLLFRNNLRSTNKGAIELDWSFPLTSKLRGYVQYFNGYGESLIDYNHANSRIGVGVSLNDWL